MPRYVTTNLRLPEAVYRELQLRASRRGRSLASLVRESLDRYLGGDADSEDLPFGSDPADALVGSVEGGPPDPGDIRCAMPEPWSSTR